MKPTKSKTEEIERERMRIRIADIVADERNRVIDEKSEKFLELVDSIRLLGVLDPIHVQRTAEGGFRLVDGERRWRAARVAGIEEVACEVWHEHVDDVEALLAGLVLNDPDKRDQHSCVHIARTLRHIKLTRGLTNEQLATLTGMPLERVRNYMALFGASECLFDFFQENAIPLYVAAALMRYEKATDEPTARRLIRRYAEKPLSVAEISALRDAAAKQKRAGEKTDASDPTSVVPRRPRFLDELESALRTDNQMVRQQLEVLLESFGYRRVSKSASQEKAV